MRGELGQGLGVVVDRDRHVLLGGAELQPICSFSASVKRLMPQSRPTRSPRSRLRPCPHHRNRRRRSLRLRCRRPRSPRPPRRRKFPSPYPPKPNPPPSIETSSRPRKSPPTPRRSPLPRERRPARVPVGNRRAADADLASLGVSPLERCASAAHAAQAAAPPRAAPVHVATEGPWRGVEEAQGTPLRRLLARRTGAGRRHSVPALLDRGTHGLDVLRPLRPVERAGAALVAIGARLWRASRGLFAPPERGFQEN